MARPGITQVQFNEVMEAQARQTGDPHKVTYAMLLGRLPASASTIRRMRAEYLQQHPKVQAFSRELPSDVVSAILSLCERREGEARRELSEQLHDDATLSERLGKECQELNDYLAEARSEAQQLATCNATFTGQLTQQASELATVRDELTVSVARVARLEQELNEARSAALAVTGRMDEIRAQSKARLEEAKRELQLAKEACAQAEHRAVSAEKTTPALEQQLSAELEARGDLQAQRQQLLGEAEQLRQECVR